MTEQNKKDILDGASHEIFKTPVKFDPWEDIPDTYDKPKLCKIESPDCEACQ